MLVTPNNPTGAVYPRETIHAFYELAKGRGIALVLDETYKDLLPEGSARTTSSPNRTGAHAGPPL